MINSSLDQLWKFEEIPAKVIDRDVTEFAFSF